MQESQAKALAQMKRQQEASGRNGQNNNGNSIGNRIVNKVADKAIGSLLDNLW